MVKHLRRHLARFGASFFLCMFLSGCSKEPPGCADERTISLVKETFWSSVAKNAVEPADKSLLSAVRQKFDVSVDIPRTSEKRADLAKVFCSAKLRVALGDVASRTVDKLFKRESEAAIEYSSQLTADGKEHVVELAGHSNPTDYVWSLTKMGAFVAQTPEGEAQPQTGKASEGRLTPITAAEKLVPMAELSRTQEGDYQAADKALNDAYQSVRGGLSDAQKVTLRDEQRVWVKRRDDACSEQAVTDESKGLITGGSAMELERATCKTKMTRDRTRQLLMLVR